MHVNIPCMECLGLSSLQTKRTDDSVKAPQGNARPDLRVVGRGEQAQVPPE